MKTLFRISSFIIMVTPFVVVSAQVYQPGETLDPACLPSPTCTVDVLYLGQTVGPNTLGTSPAFEGLVFIDNDGSGNPVISQDDGLVWDQATNTLTIGGPGDEGLISVAGISQQNANQVPVTGTNWAAQNVSASVVPSGTVTNANQLGIGSVLNLSGAGNLTGQTGLPHHAAVSGITNHSMSGTIDNVSGITGIAQLTGSGNIGTAAGILGLVSSSGSSAIQGMSAVAAQSVILGTGPITYLNGLSVNSVIAGSSPIANARGLAVSFQSFFPGTIDSGVLFETSVDSSGTHAGLDAVNDAKGFSLVMGGAGSPSLRGTNVYGINIATGSLDGTALEYGVYVADFQAKNWFAHNTGFGSLGSDPQYAVDIQESNPGGIVMRAYDGGASTCELTPSAGAGAWSCASDERLKNSIESLDSDSTIQKIRGLRPVRYYMNGQDSSTTEKQYGLIAQEVETVFPEFVQTNRSSGLKSVSYGGLVIPLVTAVQDIYDRLDMIALQTGQGVQSVAEVVQNAISDMTELFVETIKTDKLCVGSTCITEAELIKLLEAQSVTPNVLTEPSTSDVPTGDTTPDVQDQNTDPIVVEDPVSDVQTESEVENQPSTDIVIE
jgi:hypothetical protein